MCLKISFLSWILFSVYIFPINSIFKLTRADCESLDKNVFAIQTCRVKAVNRNVSEFTLKSVLLKKVRRVTVRIELLRKYNVYRRFLYNVTCDACEFQRNRNKYPHLNIIFAIFGSFSNMNHTCPYEGPLIIDKFAPKHEVLHLPLPSGEYRLDVDWDFNRRFIFVLKIYFKFEEVNQKTGKRTYEILQ